MKPFAVAHIVLGLPKYLSKLVVFQRPTIASSSSARLDKENAEIQLLNKKMMEADLVKKFSKFKTKIHDFNLPSDIIQVEKQRLISFYYICSNDDFNTAPCLMASVVVHEDMTVKAFVDSTFLQKKCMAI